MPEKKWSHLAAPPRLKRWRTATLKSTQQAAADAIGIDLAKYNAFENGRERPGIDICAAIELVTDGYVKATQWAQDLADARRIKAA